MELSIFWTRFAERKLDNIFNYYKSESSFSTASKLINNIINKTILLKTQHYIGQKEELLSNRTEVFRYLIYKNYKIIYWVNIKKSRIDIINIFDTRQNPTNIS